MFVSTIADVTHVCFTSLSTDLGWYISFMWPRHQSCGGFGWIYPAPFWNYIAMVRSHFLKYNCQEGHRKRVDQRDVAWNHNLPSKKNKTVWSMHLDNNSTHILWKQNYAWVNEHSYNLSRQMKNSWRNKLYYIIQSYIQQTGNGFCWKALKQTKSRTLVTPINVLFLTGRATDQATSCSSKYINDTYTISG